MVEIWNEFHEHFGGMTLAGLGTIFEKEMIVGNLERATRERLALLRLNSFESEKTLRSFWYPEHIVIGNFSVFNSIADYVLVQQHFPVIPISNLHVYPETTVRLVDITCDSDGEIANFYFSVFDCLLLVHIIQNIPKGIFPQNRNNERTGDISVIRF